MLQYVSYVRRGTSLEIHSGASNPNEWTEEQLKKLKPVITIKYEQPDGKVIPKVYQLVHSDSLDEWTKKVNTILSPNK